MKGMPAAANCAARRAHAVRVAVLHRPGVERSDLVVIEVGGNEGLRGELALDHLHVLGRDPGAGEPLAVGPKVGSDGRHRQARVPEQREVVGNVAGTTAVLAAHLRNEERDVQDMDLVGQDVIGEAICEHHDGVEGE